MLFPFRRLLIILILFSAVYVSKAQIVSDLYESDVLVVKLKPAYRDFFQNKSFERQLDLEVLNCRQLVSEKRSGGHSYINNIYKLKLKTKENIPQLCRELSKQAYFEYCEPNYYQELLYDVSDPKFSQQYALDLIKAKEAWDLCKGDSNIVIGITDTGFDFNHDDLKSNVAYNTSDIIDGLDNDLDGYVDNYFGWDFGDNDNNPLWNEAEGAHNILHGVFVSGLAAARTDNAYGMASVGFRTKMLPVKISNAAGRLNKGYEGILYAATHSCQIINCSWGSTVPSHYAEDVIRYVSEDLGVIVVAASGNTGGEHFYYPASYPNVVSVTATNNLDEKWNKSSYAWAVDICAPGENVLSTFPNGGFNVSSGTSFASPIVAASLAVMKAYYPDTLSNAQLVEIMKTSTDPLSFAGEGTPYHNKCGAGRLNIYKALSQEIGVSVSCSNFNLLKDGHFPKAGDTVECSGIIHNYLKTVNNLEVKLKSNSSYITLLDSTFTIDELTENATYDISDKHLRAVVHSNIYSGHNAYFTFKYKAESYEKEELRLFKMKYPAINYDGGSFKTTLYPTANMGRKGREIGWGYCLESGENLLKEMGLMIGDSKGRMATNYFYSGGFETNQSLDSLRDDSHWEAKNTIYGKTLLPIKAKVRYEHFLNEKYKNIMMLHYTLFNTETEDLDSIYLSLIANWDIMYPASNYTSVDTSMRLALTHCYNKTETAAIKLLSQGPLVRHAVNAEPHTDADGNSVSGFDLLYWYQYLSSNQYYEGLMGNGTDIVDVVGSGPYRLAHTDSLTLSFAILIGQSAGKVLIDAQNAQQLYDSLYGEPIYVPVRKNTSWVVYPNPNKGIFYVETTREEPVEVYDMLGNLIFRENKRQGKQALLINLEKHSSGLYFVRQGKRVKKIMKY